MDIIFKKLHINIPFIKALKQMPIFMKFIKDVLWKNRRFRDYKIVTPIEECRAISQNKLPPKLKDSSSFNIPCSIRDIFCGKAFCDLGASINLTPLSICRKLGLWEPQLTAITCQLTNYTLSYPWGIMKGDRVKVNKFIFLVDFIILDYEEDWDVLVILGRPFLATRRTLIDMQKG